MKKNKTISGEDAALFRESISGARKIAQDTVVHRPKRSTRKIAPEKMLQEQIDASFYFSDEFQPQLDSDGPTRYIRPDANHFELKK